MQKLEVFNVELREGTGTGSARALRREGLCPCNVYGNDKPPVSVAIDRRVLVKAVESGGYFTRIFSLKDDGGKIQERVLPRAIQFHPVTDQILHVDFQRVSKNARVNVEVPIVIVGQADSPGLRVGGVLNFVRHTIELNCPIDNIPSNLEIDVTGLAVGDSVHIESIKLPEDTKAVVERNFTVVTIASVKVEEETTTTDEEEEDTTETEGQEEEAEDTETKS